MFAAAAFACCAGSMAWGADAGIASNPDRSSTYTPGENIDVEVVFDGHVYASGSSFNLRVGTKVVRMAFDGGDGSTTLSYRYVVQAGDLDADGVSFDANALTGTITRADGSSVDRTVTALARAAGHRVDGVAPSPLATRVTTAPAARGAYAPGETLTVEVVFDEALAASTAPGALKLEFDGGVEKTASGAAAGATVSFSYDIEAGDVDTDGIVVPAQGWDVEDALGNAGRASIPRHRTLQRVDGVAPAAERATIVSNPGADGTYSAGDDIVIEVEFTEPVVAPSDTTFSLLVGADTRPAQYASGSGTDRVRYRYTVADGDTDTDGVSFEANALARVMDLVGNALAGGVPASAEQPGHRVVTESDVVAPTVTGIAITSRPERGGAYGIGQAIEVTVTFSEAVKGPADLALVLTLASGSETAALVSASNRTRALRFAYTVAEGDEDDSGVAVGPLIGGPVTDLSDSPAVHAYTLPDQREHRVDGVRPAVTGARISSDPGADAAYSLGEAIEVTVEFSETVVPVHEPDVRLPLKVGAATRRAHLAEAGEAAWTFRYVVQKDDIAADGVSVTATAFEGGGVRDLAGNGMTDGQENLGFAEQPAHVVDAAASTGAAVAIVSDAGADQTYGIGELIEVEVTFDEDVRVTGSPQLVLTFASDADAPVERVAALARQGPRLLAFRYRVQHGDTDSNGLSIVAGALVGASVVDVLGNPAGAIVPIVNDEAHKVDGIPPQVLTFRIVSDPGADGVYGLNQTLAFEVEFSEIVHVKEIGSELVLDVSVGRHTRAAAYVGGSGTPVLRFEYVVQGADRDEDGISLDADAIRCDGGPDGCSVADNAGNGATARRQGLPVQPGHRVDGRLNQARLAIVSQPRQAETYGPGEAIEIVLAFSERVNVYRTDDEVPLPRLALSIGGTEGAALFAGGSGTSTLRFRYVVRAGDYDADGVSVGPGPGALQGGRIVNAGGRDVSRRFGPLAPSAQHRVDGVMPTVTRIAIVSAPLGDSYGVGESIELEVTFAETVHVTASGDEPTLLLGVGRRSRPASYIDGSGTSTLSFRYVVAAGDVDVDGVSVGPDALVGGVIEDTAGNDWQGAARRLPPLAPQAGHAVDATVDALGPSVLAVTVTTSPSAVAYAEGETLEVDVGFSELVYVTGSPRLRLAVGGATREAALADGSGTDALTFAYMVVADDLDLDGIAIGPGPGGLVGGVIADGVGNEADRTFEGVARDPGQRVDGRPSAVRADVQVRSAPGGPAYRAGEAIEVAVTFDRVVHVSGDPVLELRIGGATRQALFVDGSGTRRLSFRYVVEAGDHDADGISIAADALTGGTLTGPAGGAVPTDLTAVAPEDGQTVDARPAELLAVEIASRGGTYGVGERIEFVVTFDEAVLVAGDPVLLLSVGGATRVAGLTGGGGTPTLVFAYEVAPGDSDDDGISVPADALTGGVITDVAGNAVERGFAGLAADVRHLVAGRLASVLGPPELVSDPGPDGTYGVGDAIEVALTFGAPVHVDGAPVLIVRVGAAGRAATLVGGSGTTELLFRYVVQVGDEDEDGISIAANALTGGAIRDESGRPASYEVPALASASGARHRVLGLLVSVLDSPDVTSDPGTDGTYVVGDVIEVTLRFSEAVHVAGEPALIIRIGGAERGATLAEGSGTEALVFRYVVQSGDEDEDGISIAANALTGGSITDGDGNPVNRRFEGRHARGHRVGAATLLALEPIVAEVHVDARVDLVVALRRAGVVYEGPFTAESYDPAVAIVRAARGALTVVPLAVGETLVIATATRAPITLLIPVVVEPSQAERAVLEAALAAVGRGLLSSNTATVARRLEVSRGVSPPRTMARRSAAARSGGAAARGGWPDGHRGGAGVGHPAGAGPFGGLPGAGRHGVARPSEHRAGEAVRPYGRLFAMDLAAGSGRPVSWGVWAGADRQSFDGGPADGSYGGELQSFHAGVDARGEGWVAGAAVTRAQADVSYEFGERSGGTGTLGVDLTMATPYVQWTPSADALFWAVLGFGTGDATTRGGGAGTEASSTLGARLGLAGARIAAFSRGAFKLALRGDGGAVGLETDDGLQAVDGLRVSAQRVRAGLEASFALDLGNGSLTPFLDAGGRWDAGDGHTGGGVEVSGGVRYRGPLAGVEVSARSLVMHGEDAVGETGLSATVFVEPDERGRGWRLSLTPHRGQVGSTGVPDAWRGPPGPAARSGPARWQVDGRMGYGFAVDRTGGTVTPFGEFGSHGRARVARGGVAYEGGGRASPIRLQITAESTQGTGDEADGVGVVLTAEARW